MKVCASCKEEKPLDAFHKQTKALDGKQSNCKECNKEQRKAYYKTAHGRDKNVTAGKRWSYQNRKRVFEYLQNHKCVDCPETDPVVLEFDHRDPGEKSFTIGGRGSYNKSWATLLAEIEKCDVRCANCHRRRTAKQFGWSKLAWMEADVLE